jgi:hypothetical protein
MSSDRNKIAQELTVEQLSDFVGQLAALPGKDRTLSAIKERAAALGIEISLMSAKAFRDTTFERHLQRMRTAQEVALQVEGIEQGGNTLASASAKLLSKRIFNQLLEAEENDEAGVDVDALSLSISRLRSGDVATATHQLKIQALELAQFNAAEQALKHARELKTISENKSLDEKEKIERVRLKLFGPAPEAPK